MEKFGNLKYISSLSGMFRLLTLIVGLPSLVLSWIAYFSSSWTKSFPEITAILIAEKNLILNISLQDPAAQLTESPSNSEEQESSSSSESDSNDYDLITDKEEEYLDEILLQTLLYEKFFIGIVSLVFLISLVYFLVRVLTNHEPDSPYEIMFDFIYHVLAALGLLTGGALVLLSAAKIQSFIDHVSQGFAPDIITTIIGNNTDVQDKTDKIAAAVLGILNSVLYIVCVITIQMTEPIKCSLCKKRRKNRKMMMIYQYQERQKKPIQRFPSISSFDHPIDRIGIYDNNAFQ